MPLVRRQPGKKAVISWMELSSHESLAPTPQHVRKLRFLRERKLDEAAACQQQRRSRLPFFPALSSVDLRRQADFILLFTGTF